MPQTTPTAGSTAGYRGLGDDFHAPRVDVGALPAPGEELAQLAARLQVAAATVEAQAAVHRGLLAVDWSGAAATAFTGLVAVRAVQLERLATTLADLAATASRRADAGGALRSAAGWAS